MQRIEFQAAYDNLRERVAANLPEKAEKTSILSIVSWLLLLTFTPAVDLAVAVPLRPL